MNFGEVPGIGSRRLKKPRLPSGPLRQQCTNGGRFELTDLDAMDFPSTVRFPLVACRSRVKICRVVDFPAPLMPASDVCRQARAGREAAAGNEEQGSTEAATKRKTARIEFRNDGTGR